MTALAPAYGSAEWKAERRNGLYASEMSKIARVSKYGGPLDVYFEKRGLLTVEETPAMRRGHIYEPAIAQEYAERFPDVSLSHAPTLAHPQFDWLRATPDRFASASFGRYLLEIKTVTPYLMHEYGPDGSDQLPDDKIVQVQTQLLVTGLPLAHVAVAFGWETRVYPIERDLETQQMLLEMAHDFWHNYHLANVEPDPLIGVDSESVIRRKYATHNDTVLVADDVATAVIRQLAEAKRDLADAEERETLAKQRLMTIIGAHKAVDSTAGRVTWGEVKGRESLDIKGLLTHLNVPEEVKQSFTRVGAPSRQMRFYEPKRK